MILVRLICSDTITISHLAAGIMDILPTGDDTSWLEWVWTRKYGINTLSHRMPQHGPFYAVDADCVGLTNKIPWESRKPRTKHAWPL
jgi:alpha-galactosidase